MDSSLLNIFTDVYFKTPEWTDYVLLTLSILFLAFSAFFSSAEVAYFSLEKEDLDEIEESEETKDKAIIRLLGNPQKLLATIIIGRNVTIISFIILTLTFVYSVFDFTEMPIWGFVGPFAIISVVFITFSELMPKVYSSEFSIQTVRKSSITLLKLQTFFRPFVELLAESKALVYSKLTRVDMNTISVDELSHALDLTTETQEEDKELLEGIIKFGNIQVSDIMTSRVDMVDIDTKLNFKQLMDLVKDSGYSRLPVYSGTRDNIKGILFSKDLLPFLDKPETFRWQTLIRQAYYVPETKKIDDLLIEFQENRIHLALVVDEYGGISGLITLEDIIEEIVGDISDEYDEEEILFQKIDNHTYIFEAKILLNDFFKITEIDEKDFEKITEEVETLAGMILEIKGEMPVKNEMLQFEHYVFEILQADKRRIKKVKLHIKNDPDNEHDDED
ncbi:MAG: gliding motility-associated protein GldE [Porphyromonadaceae bacterium]|nr:gliding motility-associated protein GldE [Porphyromonadaceae bacterium]